MFCTECSRIFKLKVFLQKKNNFNEEQRWAKTGVFVSCTMYTFQ
jgi:hypothetical protein